MHKIPCGPTVAFDVDDTLVMWSLPKGVDDNDENLVTVCCRGYEQKMYPNKYNIDLLKKMASRGHAVIVWSAGGSDWAEAVVHALGLEKYVNTVSGKLQYYIDDISNPKEWIGKHGYFTIDGQRIHGDNIPKGEQNGN